MLVVVAYGGEWEDTWSNNEVCSNDRSKLEQYIADKQAERAAKIDFQTKLNELYNATVEANPKREATLQRRERKSWPTGLGQAQITQAMRDERKAVQDHNEAVIQELCDIQQEWLDQVWFPIYRQFMADNGKPVPEVINYSTSMGTTYFQDISYEIEEIPEL